MIDEVLQAALELLALGDVLNLRDQVQRLSLVVANERDAQQHPEQTALGVPEPLFDLIARHLSAKKLHELRRVDVNILCV